ncbi:MAG: DUF1961 family protein, partial [Verrucomicrobiae bacterium]|nr:DUF1961 family protein [Verrucomicrobiae bacterium]
GGTNNWRTNVTMRTQDNGKLAWRFQRQTVQPERITTQELINEGAPIPYDRWFFVEMFWKWGKQGRIWFAVDGETIFDEWGKFEHPDNPLGLKFWALFKNYRGFEWYDADLSNGDETYHQYDDLELWTDFPPGHPMRTERALYVQGFENMDGPLPSEWWLEGEAIGAKARIEDGRLRVIADQAKSQVATVWLNKPVKGDLELSFDVQVLSSVGQVNNMNLFFLFQSPDGKPLIDSRNARADAGYKKYHGSDITGTIITFLANEGNEEEGRFRLRRAPPFNPPISEFFGYEAKAGETYKVRVRKVGNRIRYFVNGIQFLDGEVLPTGDPDQGGYIGFRTFQTDLWWDNIVVKQLLSSGN